MVEAELLLRLSNFEPSIPESLPGSAWEQAYLLKSERDRLDRDKVVVCDSAYVGGGHDSFVGAGHLIEPSSQAGSRHQEATSEGVGKPLLSRGSSEPAEDRYLRLKATGQKMPILVGYGPTSAFHGMAGVDRNASPELLGVGK